MYSDTSGPWQQRVTLVKMNPHSGLPSFFNVSTLKIILSNFVIRIIANPWFFDSFHHSIAQISQTVLCWSFYYTVQEFLVWIYYIAMRWCEVKELAILLIARPWEQEQAQELTLLIGAEIGEWAQPVQGIERIKGGLTLNWNCTKPSSSSIWTQAPLTKSLSCISTQTLYAWYLWMQATQMFTLIN